MKKLYLLLACVMLWASNITSQVVNVNPDPNGEPWLAGTLRPLTAEDWEFLNNLPELTTPPELSGRGLPPEVDNTQQPYFRSIFNQDGGSCGQASGMGYCFTYEIDCERQVPANNLVTQYPTHYTWNFLNGGYGGGSWHFDGWMIAKASGCPNVLDWGGTFYYGGPSRWMSGYSEYYNGMHNKVEEIYSINVGTPSGIESMKNWLFDHMGKMEPGGLICFAAGVSNSFTMTNLPAGTPQAGKAVVIHWDSEVNHAMTIVGFNDSIRYDFNGDGQYTNHIDINDDGIVNVKDWEIGGVKWVNSWGTGFGNGGSAYMMYKLLAESIYNGGIWEDRVHMIKTRETYAPYLALKATIKHTCRNKIRIEAGVSADTNATEPAYILEFPLFYHQGGNLYMQGGYSEADKTLELGLDVTPLLGHITSGQPARFFLRLVEMDLNNEGTGEIISYSIVDYTNGEDEVACAQQNVPIVEHGTTILSVCKTVDFDSPQITTSDLPVAVVNEPYFVQLEGTGGSQPYVWDVLINYSEGHILSLYPEINDEQLIPTSDDDGYAVKELDFSFPFFGQYYDQVTVLTDGSIVFDDQFFYIRDDNKLINSKAITPYGCDLMIYPDEGEGIWYKGDANSATFRWKTSRFNEPNFYVDVVATLYPDGRIDILYNNEITEGSGWTAGISKGDGESYTISSISGAYTIPDNYALRFFPPDFPAGMSISPDGIFSGIPMVDNYTWDVVFKVTDHMNISTTKALEFSTLHVGLPDPGQLTHLSAVKVSPNPFGTDTRFQFTLNRLTDIELSVYNLSGQKVRTLIPETSYPEGAYETGWDGSNDSGQPLVNGIYYYILRTNNENFNGKVLIMR
jgi:hypothetical protein